MCIKYVQGDATAPTQGGNRIIAHICNDAGGWGRGFVLGLSARFSGPEAAYRAWYRGDWKAALRAGALDEAGGGTEPFRLGAVQLVQVAHDLWVANMIAQHNTRPDPRKGEPPVRYTAIEEALSTVAEWAHRLGATVHMPRIGTGLAGGSWEQIEPIIVRALCDRGVDVTVYEKL